MLSPTHEPPTFRHTKPDRNHYLGLGRKVETECNLRELPRMEWSCARRRATNDFMQAAFVYDLLLQQPWLPYDAERRARLQRAFAKAREGGEEWEQMPIE